MARKILLADDSVTAQNMGRKILADAGYEVITVNNGSAALKKIGEVKPELIVLDVYMPGYSGLEVCQRLKESQETARIPVLLSVGKLEPFKPEEAKRVRADAFIVKPFEASELLSALTKLEDKIVPRQEGSKPGRFARAMAAVEGRTANERAANENDEDSGWKNRISFPKKKEGSEEKSSIEKTDDAEIYNQVNRDLRTVVQREGEKPAGAEKIARPEVERIDASAVAASGLPKDVTSEEISALVAAAAQMRSKRVESEASPITTENKTVEAAPTPPAEQKEVAEIKSAATQESEKAPTADISANASAIPTLAHDDVMTAIAGLGAKINKSKESTPGNGAAHAAEEKDDLPVTMAVSAISSDVAGTRWTAVSVAVDPQEGTISLEQEMQKAYAAFAAAAQSGPATFHAAAHVMETPATLSEPATAVLPPLPSINETKLEPVPAPIADVAPDTSAAALSSEPTPDVKTTKTDQAPDDRAPEDEIKDSQATASSSAETEIQTGAATESAVADAAPANVVESTPQIETAQPEASTSESQDVAEPSQPAMVAADVTPAQAQVETKPEESSPLPEAAAAVATSAAVSSPTVIHDLPPIETATGDAPAHKESELMATTAAAWASWRQSRDGSGAASSVQPEQANAPASPASEISAEISAPALAETALAVAAGAEANPQAVSAQDAQISTPAATSTVDPKSVASIVDNLLAELRPKIVEEISKKLAAEKK